MSTFHSLRITDLRTETEQAVSIAFDIPEHLKDEFLFIPGQYLTVKKEISGEEIRRAYSICSALKTEPLRIAVKAVPNGTFSVFAINSLKVGDVLDVSKPEGKFVLNSEIDSNKNFLGIAAGSGITPIMAMIKTALFDFPKSTFTLLYGNKSENDTIFKLELEQLLADFPDRFHLHLLYSREHVENSVFGRVDQGNMNFILNKNHANIHFDQAFLCGPESLIEEAKTALISRGIEERNISFELFSSPVSTDLDTKLAFDGTSKVTVLLDDEETTFEMDAAKSVLTAALLEGLDAPYSCQGGICSSCLGKVTEGHASMDKNTILTEDEVNDGFILTCQAHPTTQKITIDYDDV